ncbi:MAG: CBS domain-containing protein [Thermodesulfobacteriota bacterium]
MATARDLMTKHFHTIRPDASVADAVRMFAHVRDEDRPRVFGLMVTDEEGRLVGIMSLYDILVFVRPKHIHVWGVMRDGEVSELLEGMAERAQSVKVRDIMSAEVVSVTLETNLMEILDLMIRKHVRRIPVLNGNRIEGIVYISDVFDHVAEKLCLRRGSSP